MCLCANCKTYNGNRMLTVTQPASHMESASTPGFCYIVIERSFVFFYFRSSKCYSKVRGCDSKGHANINTMNTRIQIILKSSSKFRKHKESCISTFVTGRGGGKQFCSRKESNILLFWAPKPSPARNCSHLFFNCSNSI